ncbi:MAG TPA: hypothetical protein VM431_08560 [Phycisphaerae bacterium]|nr:hypothetical protein [Phycisphaerae bacterium]
MTPRSVSPDGSESAGPPARLSGWRLWAARLVAVVAAPVLVLSAAEGVLRLAGHGCPPEMFVRTQGGDAYRSNGTFSRRFFPLALAREPYLATFPARKAKGTFRIFVLGGSAAQGVPSPEYGFWRFWT